MIAKITQFSNMLRFAKLGCPAMTYAFWLCVIPQDWSRPPLQRPPKRHPVVQQGRSRVSLTLLPERLQSDVNYHRAKGPKLQIQAGFHDIDIGPDVHRKSPEPRDWTGEAAPIRDCW